MLSPMLLTSRLTRLMTALILLVSIGMVEGFYYLLSENRLAQEEAAATQSLSTLRTKIESQANSAIYLVEGLSAYIRAYPDAGADQVEPILKHVYQDGKNVRSLAIAPDLVIRMVYPRAGNESVLGLDFRHLDLQWPYVKKAIELKDTVLDGPVNLVQGGKGLVNRIPIFRDNGQLWGMVSVVLDIGSLLESADIDQYTPSFNLHLYNPSKPDGGDIFGTADAIHTNTSEVIRLPLYLHNESWMLEAVSLKAHVMPWWMSALRVVGWLTALLIALMYFILMREHGRNRILANFDELTGLPNRRAFYRQVEQLLKQLIPSKSSSSQTLSDCVVMPKSNAYFGVVYLDLNGFKAINDTYGHEAGDEVLVAIAQRLSRLTSRHERFFRLGGDEFVGILRFDEASGVDVMVTACQRINLAVKEGIELTGGVTVALSTAIGYTLIRSGDDIDLLLSRADQQMYQHKQQAVAERHA